MAELVVAMAVLAVVLIPLTYVFVRDQQVCRQLYQRAITGEILDGEMEVLVAGAWREAPEGTHPYVVRAEAAKNLAADRFFLTRSNQTMRLEYLPEKPRHGVRLVREGRGR
jgi:hypothetical protein